MIFRKSVATAALVLLPAVAFAQLPSPCLNSDDYRYPGENKSGQTVLRSCSNIRIKETRRQTLCLLSEVRTACPQTCGLCCEDDPTFSFPMKKEAKSQKCTWIAKNNVSVRQAEYCTIKDTVGSTTIRNMCPKSCNFCKTLVPLTTAAPVKSPTGTGVPTISAKPIAAPSRPPSPMPSPFPTSRPSFKPSQSPSGKPSQVPSILPSLKPSQNPSDLPTLKPSQSPSSKPSLAPSSLPSLKPSQAPSSKPSQAPSSLPSLKPSQAPSSKPSLKPSQAPSSKPSQNPSDGPSNKPTQSIKPSATPSKAPVGAPTVPVPAPVTPPVAPPVAGCVDNSLFKFTLDYDASVEKNCAWITKNASKEATRKAIYCGKGEIKYKGCPATCDGCGTCADDATFKFELLNQEGELRNCSWITKSKNAAVRNSTYCPTVGSKCPQSCGYCA